jgi:hypothetical protein
MIDLHDWIHLERTEDRSRMAIDTVVARPPP